MSYLQDQEYLIWAKVPKTVVLPQAAAHGVSIGDYDKTHKVVEVFDSLAKEIIDSQKN